MKGTGANEYSRDHSGVDNPKHRGLAHFSVLAQLGLGVWRRALRGLSACADSRLARHYLVGGGTAPFTTITAERFARMQDTITAAVGLVKAAREVNALTVVQHLTHD